MALPPVNPLGYVAIFVYAFLGLLFGYILGRIAPEEIKPGKKIFRSLKDIILLLVFGLVLFFVPLDILMLVFVVVGFLLGFFIRDYYFYFGVVVWSMVDLFSGVLVAVLVFIFGLVEGTFKYKDYSLFFKKLFYYVVPVVLIVLFNVELGSTYLSSIFLGFLLKEIIRK